MRVGLLLLMLFLMNAVFAQEQMSVFFESNKYELNAKEEAKLKDWIGKNKASKIVAINGYTDEVGTSSYNDSLAQKRVDFVFDYIKDKINIRGDFKSRSFGEKFAQTGNDAENRRTTVFYILEEDLERENEILGIKEVSDTTVVDENAPLHEKIKHAKKGDKIILKNINFHQNTFAITQDSNGALYDLLFVMQNNPTLRVQIQGHICCVDKDRRNLSLERAKQVRRFLVFKGVSQQRVFVTGFGVTKPLHSIPEETEEKAAENRRVELEIISK
uniref:OmpA family protein n=2 Tax=Flavobacterium sp. TaxID=239 RepID=UPI004048C82E